MPEVYAAVSKVLCGLCGNLSVPLW